MSNEVTDANRWSALTLGDVIARSRRKADEQTSHAETLLEFARITLDPRKRSDVLHTRGLVVAEVGHALVMAHAAERELATLAKRGGR